MNSRELIQRLVLNSISDDYENVDQVILRDVARDCAKLGITVERADVADALGELIKDGLAKAYILSSTPIKELQGMPPLDFPEEYFETYFYITRKRMDFRLSDDTWWPFDDEGEPRAL